MKPISKLLIAAGTGLLFLICILIGVLYYRNLNRNEEEMAVSIERNLKQYLNERVEELNPQFLKQEGNAEKIDELSEHILKELSEKLNKENLTWDELLQYFSEEQITRILDYVVNNFKNDWLSQFITEAGDIFITEEEYEIIGEEFLAALKEEMKTSLDKMRLEIENNILEVEKRIAETQALIEKLEKEAATTASEVKKLKEKAASDGKELENLKNKLTVVGKELESIKVEMKTALAELETLKKEIETAGAEMEILKKEMKTTGMELDALEKEVKTVTTEVETLKTEISTATTAIENLKKKDTELEQRISAVGDSILAMNTSFSEIQSEIKLLKTNVNVKVEKWDADTATLYLVPVQ